MGYILVIIEAVIAVLCLYAEFSDKRPDNYSPGTFNEHDAE